LIQATILGSAVAAPAIVWNNIKGSGESSVFSSYSVNASLLLADVAKHSQFDDSSLASAIFLLERSETGAESLTGLTTSGSLPGVSSKYSDATVVHSYVSGMESSYSVAHAAATQTGGSVVELSLSEFVSQIASLGKESQRVQAQIEIDQNGITTNAPKSLTDADILIINIPASTQPKEIDEAVVLAIQHNAINSVILSALRSKNEAGFELNMEKRRRMKIVNANANAERRRRRLENANGNDDGYYNNEDYSQIYYVQMTPNMLAGITFFFMFALVTLLGLQCMGSISGQDCYVKKKPMVGREA